MRPNVRDRQGVGRDGFHGRAGGPCIESLEARRLLSAAYTLTRIGGLKGYAEFTAAGLNDAGDVVGHAGQVAQAYAPDGGQAFLHRGGRTLAVGPRDSVATGINDKGQVVGASSTAGGRSTHPFLASPDGRGGFNVIDFHDRVAAPDDADGYGDLVVPRAVNNAGQVAGETVYFWSGDQSAWVYAPGGDAAAGPREVRGAPGDTNNAALAINGYGTTAGYTGPLVVSNAYRAANTAAGAAAPTTIRALGPPPFSSIRAFGINDGGQVVGESFVGDDAVYIHAFLYANGRTHDLGTLPGADDSAARDVNNQGVVGGGSGGRAFVFRGGRMTDLNTLAPRQAGVVLTEAVAVNDRGQIAVNGTAGGRRAAFLLTPSGATGTIAGRVFHDRNRDRVYQKGEAALRGRQVYVDADRDGRYDPGERTTFTNAAGAYRLTGLPAGRYRVAATSGSAWAATATAAVKLSRYHELILGTSAGVKDFAEAVAQPALRGWFDP